MATKNPWMGIASYEEPQGTNGDYLFCGRDEETLDVVRLVENNLFVTLYGSSGVGKTSLLRAGVIPILKRKDYMPLYVRLSQETTNISYAEAIVRRIESCGIKTERTSAARTINGNDRTYLWHYFATTRFCNESGREVYPVIILDQFEEIFRDADKEKAELLLKQIYLLLNDELEIPYDDGWSADTNYRFIASIREDFLFVLEDSIDELSLDLYKNNRYRLRAMKPNSAKSVILIPGKDCIADEQKDKVAERIIGLAKQGYKNEIDSILLSLVCAGTYNKVIDNNSSALISANDLQMWHDNPMEVYYKDAVKNLSARQIRYIQRNLIRDDGSRKQTDTTEVRTALGNDTFEQLTHGKNRMLTLGEHGTVELMHDKLALAVYNERKAFEERERKKLMRRRALLIGTIILAIVIIFIIQNEKLRQEQWNMKENNSRFVAEKARTLATEDSYVARLLLMEILPENLDDPDKPYTLEAEVALREVVGFNSTKLIGHSGYVKSTTFNFSGNRIASASDDGTVRVWDATTGNQLLLLEYSSNAETVSFTPDNNSIISSYGDGTILVWNALTGEKESILNGHDKWVNSIAISPNGRHIVSTSWDNTIRKWDIETQSQLYAFNSDEPINYVSYSPDGLLITTAMDNGYIYIMDAATGSLLSVLEGHLGKVSSALFSHDGKRIVSASDDLTVRIWDVATGETIRVLNGTNAFKFAAFSPDDRYIVFNSTDGEIYVYDDLSYSIIWDKKNDSDWASPVTFSPDGKRILSTSSGNTINVYDFLIDESTKILEGHTGRINNIAVSPDGKYIASISQEDPIRIWDITTGNIIRELLGHRDIVNSVSFSSDSKRLVSTSYDNTMRIWDVASGKSITINSVNVNNNSAFKTAEFSSDDKSIISISDDNTINIWDANNGNKKQTIKGNKGLLYSAVFSPDDKYIVSAYNDAPIRLWDASSGKMVCEFRGNEGSRFAKFNNKGNCVISASNDKSIRLWNVSSGENTKVLKGHTNTVNSVAFSPDDKFIVSASNDKTARIWDVSTGKPIYELKGHTDKVNYATFTPDGQHIVTASDDKTIRIWDFLPLQELIDSTRRRFAERRLTDEEKLKYYIE